ncbi:MAG: lactonase family protein [Planctomycetaceae bacterium]|nr:lactonase family protein [Planctomycetaceae bacterium]
MTTFLADYSFALLALVIACLALSIPVNHAVGDDSIAFYLGTYTKGDSRGIYQAQLDTASGKLHSLELAGELENPSFLALHPTKPVVYAVSEVADYGGESAGAVSALRRDPVSDRLTLLSQQTTKGAHPCHVSVTPCGKFVMAANYSGGSVACYPVQEDGNLGPMSSFVQHEGSSVSPRQKGPHAHSINPDPAGRFFYAADLGADKIFIYRLDGGKLVPNQPAFAALAPGSGPRHFTFHPNQRFAYVINELASTITAFDYDAETGALAEIQTVGTLPAGFDGQNTTAEVRVHPSGKFLYGSNRGHDSIAAFRIDAETGKLTPVGHTPSGGKSPRNFTPDPSGRFVLAAHQNSDNVVAFRVDQETGLLQPTGSELAVGSPVCVVFVPE